MNVFSDDIEVIAERLKLRVIARGNHMVYVKPSGQVSSYAASDCRVDQCDPNFWIGTYTREYSTEEIEDDLMARVAELAKVRR